ncbi:RHS repeat domain-containing protein, partial [Olivibacter sp. CPCC 100613]|uniref:RHS repeat domain-containing protein n=1 Tax=Olivibacter sp. CPCC 100613 TaxID=3079931 RepID=UPI002FF632FA
MNRFFIYFILLCHVPCYAQEAKDFMPERAINYVPSSPDVGNLLRSGNIPVNMFTGAAQLSIPIYSLKVKDFEMPISLSYQGSGIKIEEIAPSTGMGWTLNVGGVISKNIRGTDDDFTDGYPNGSSGVKVNKYIQGQLTAAEKAVVNYSMATGAMDGEPDIFSYKFGEYHGKFIFSPNGEIIQLDGEKLDISRQNGNFVIIDPKGNKFYFNDREETQNIAQYSANGSQSYLDTYTLISSWYLSKVVLKNGQSIAFQYIVSNISPSYEAGLSLYILQSVSPALDCTGNPPAPNYLSSSTKNITNITQKKMSKIILPTGTIEMFYQTNDRTDLAGDKALDKIAIFGAGSSYNEEYSFAYKYYSGRLFLDKLFVKSMTAPYQFIYDESGTIPPRNSKAQDYWGFNNGKTQNQSLIPKSKDPKDLSSGNYFYDSGGDREPVFNSMKLGLLTGVNYPTGGETKFIYESHDYGNVSGQQNVLDTIRQYQSASAYVNGQPTGSWSEVSFRVDFTHEVVISSRVTGPNTRTRVMKSSGEVLYTQTSSTNGGTVTDTHKMYLGPGDYKLMAFNYESEFIVDISLSYQKQTSYTLSHKRAGGGARIREVVDYSSPGNIASRRSYQYTLNGDTSRSSGILITTGIFEFMEKRSGVVGSCGIGFTYDAIYRVRSSTPAVPLYSTSGSHVEYQEVTETYANGTGNGRTLNTYVSSMNPENRDINIYSYPFMPSISREYKRGMLLVSKVYKEGSANPIKETINEYQSIPSTDAIYGLSIRFDKENPQIPDYSTYNFNSYFVYRDFYALKNTTTKSYESGVIHEIKMSYEYENPKHYQQTKITETTSDGNKEVITLLYPQDYATGTAFIDNMKSNHLIAYPIEQVRYKEVGTTRTILSGTITKYLEGGQGHIDQIMELESSAPIALSSFKFSNRLAGQLPSGSIGATAFSPFSGYRTRLTYSNYDAYGNPRQVQPVGGPPVTYIWSYKGQYPVAEIRNGGFATVQTALGGDQAVKTFTDSHPSDTDLRARFNGIRASLPNSMLSYYTYDILSGMTSATDPSGRTVYYNYDGFGRLKEVKDTQSKTTDTYEYHYRN